LPFNYLGLPLSDSKSNVHEFLPLVHGVEKRLISTAMVLTQGGKVFMVDSVLSSLPTFYMSSVKCPIGILKHIDRYIKHYLWRGGDLNAKKISFSCLKIGV
jgi:hypothetical protein